MNHCVPDFEIEMDDNEYPIPSSSGVPRPKKPSMPEDDIMELLWQNGQVVMQSQNQRPLRKPPERYTDSVIPAGASTVREIRPSQQEAEHYHNQHLFMLEDEMASWLHYPIVDDPPFDQNFYADILYPPPPPPPTPSTVNNSNQNNNSTMQNHVRTSQVTELRTPSRSAAPRPPIPPPRKPEQVKTKIPNFTHFSKHNARVEPAGPSNSKAAVKESTVVDSCDTPAGMASASRVSETVRNSVEPTEDDAARGTLSTAGVAATSAGGDTGLREATTWEMTATSSPGGSSGSAEPAQRLPAEDRKRKGREIEDSDGHCVGVDFESAEAKRQTCGSTSTKRSRAAEVHNLSERRRRDRINEKMRALQELIPRCNKSDKASMLDEAIEYLKSLQLQVQMMSMGCGMVPIMFPGIQQYMPTMGMRMGIGMGMGMEMGMNRPLMPFPNMLPASALPPAATATATAAAATAHLGPRFPVPPFHMPHVPPPDSSRIQASTPTLNQPDNNMVPSLVTPDPNQSRIPNFSDPYHQYLGPHQVHLQLMQNQAMNNPNVSKPSTSKSHEDAGNNQPGMNMMPYLDNLQKLASCGVYKKTVGDTN